MNSVIDCCKEYRAIRRLQLPDVERDSSPQLPLLGGKPLKPADRHTRRAPAKAEFQALHAPTAMPCHQWMRPKMFSWQKSVA